jgi:hypothetical protein
MVYPFSFVLFNHHASSNFTCLLLPVSSIFFFFFFFLFLFLFLSYSFTVCLLAFRS